MILTWSRSLGSGGTGIGGVGVGANLVSEFLGDRSATDHDLNLVAQTGLSESLDGRVDGRHGGGQQSGEAHDLALGMSTNVLDELLGSNVDAEVSNLDTLALDPCPR